MNDRRQLKARRRDQLPDIVQLMERSLVLNQCIDEIALLEAGAIVETFQLKRGKAKYGGGEAFRDEEISGKERVQPSRTSEIAPTNNIDSTEVLYIEFID